MKKENKTLSDWKYPLTDKRWVYPESKVKEKIQNVERRLKNYIRLKCVHPPFNLIKKLDKIFKEEFGKDLLKK